MSVALGEVDRLLVRVALGVGLAVAVAFASAFTVAEGELVGESGSGVGV